MSAGIIAGMISDELYTIFSLDYIIMYIQFHKHLLFGDLLCWSEGDGVNVIDSSSTKNALDRRRSV